METAISLLGSYRARTVYSLSSWEKLSIKYIVQNPLNTVYKTWDQICLAFIH